MEGEIIYEYGKNPINYGRIINPSLTYTEKNHSCGENLTIDLMLVDDIVAEIGFISDGRLVGVAAMSLLSEAMENQALANIENFTKHDILAMLEVETLTDKRLKSALLGLLTFKNAYRELNNQSKLEMADLIAD